MKYLMASMLVAGFSAAAAADEVKLANGHTLVGVAREESGKVTVETVDGTVTVPSDQVKGVTPGRTVLHEYYERVAALGTGPRAAQVFELALWARDRGLNRYNNALLQWTVALDPDHAEARRMLGYVRDEGRWVPAREREAILTTRVEKAYPRMEQHPRAYVRRTHPTPEVSPGYVYFGIPPSLPPRGSQNHGYNDTYSFSYPSMYRR